MTTLRKIRMYTYQSGSSSVGVFGQVQFSASHAYYVLILLLVMMACCSQSLFADITLTRVADTTTTIPGGIGNFTRFDWLSLDRGTLVFANDRRGIYRFRDGQLENVVDAETILPDGLAFFDLRYPAVDGETIVFWGRSSDGIASYTKGVYSFTEGNVSAIADTNTTLPDGNGSFAKFSPPVVQDGRVAFVAETDSGEGVFLFDQEIRTVADVSTVVPGKNELFQGFFSRVRIDGRTVMFGGNSATEVGIFGEIDGKLERIVSKDSTELRTIADFSTNDGNVIFRGIDEVGKHGIYESAMGSGGSLTRIADADSFEPALLDPGYPFPRSSIALASADGFAILANTSDGEHGIFWFREGEWTQVAKSGELLDGLPISRIEPFDGHELSDTQLGFTVNFEGNGQAVYLATIPEPSALALLMIGCLTFFRLPIGGNPSTNWLRRMPQ